MDFGLPVISAIKISRQYSAYHVRARRAVLASSRAGSDTLTWRPSAVACLVAWPKVVHAQKGGEKGIALREVDVLTE